MATVVSVRFRGGSKTYYFDPGELNVCEDQFIIVETAQGIEYARCVEGNHEVPDQSVIQPLRPVVRIATDRDHHTAAANCKKEQEAFAICEKKIEAHGLDMKLVSVECSFEGNKIIFFFTAEGRVDFRELVKDLASVFRARIELRQIGVRDGAKMLGGLGICGRPLCCNQFLSEFMPVSIKMAKTQNLSLNPTKISGTCGRLMCCLKYEQNCYEDAAKRMPKNDSFVMTPDGPGNITGVNLLAEEATVRLDESPESPRKYKGCELVTLRNGKGSREGIEIPRERPERYIAPTEEEDTPLESRLSSAWEFPLAPEDHPFDEHHSGEASGSHKRRRSNRKNSRSTDCHNHDLQVQNPEKSQKEQKSDKPQKEQNKEQRTSQSKSNRNRRNRRPNSRPAQQQPVQKVQKSETVERLQVKPNTGTTAEMKAAADRAARQQSGDSSQKKQGSNQKPHRKYRPRKKTSANKEGQ